MNKQILQHVGLRRAYEDIERLRFAGYEPKVTRNGVRCPKVKKNPTPGEYRKITSHWDEKMVMICLKVMDGELELLDELPADELPLSEKRDVNVFEAKVGDAWVRVLPDLDKPGYWVARKAGAQGHGKTQVEAVRDLEQKIANSLI